MKNPLDTENEQTFFSHLVELRDRLLRVVLCVLIVFLATASYANEIYAYLAEPLLQHMPKNSTMIAIDVASPFFTPFKLAFVVAVFIAIPFILYQFWGFVAPGLYRHEKMMVLPLMFASTVLFYSGAAFAYYLVFPLVFGYLTSTAPVGVSVMTDIATYLDFVLGMFFAFGVSFEIPIFTIVLVMAGIVTPQELSEKRPYVIVGVFVIAMFLTPPDALSQTLLAIPMWMLFESGLLFSRIMVRRQQDSHE
jgi:sec-independent protein translocase protein TatC